MSKTDEELKDKVLLEKIEELKLESSPDDSVSPSPASNDFGSAPAQEKVKEKRGSRRGFQRDYRKDPERLREWEESQKNKEVIETGLKGTVKWYSLRFHYGFIARDDGKGDIFVHQSAIAKSSTEKFYLRSLAYDQPVEFNIVKGEKGVEASHVTGPDDTEVKEVKFRRNGYHPKPFRRRYQKKNGEDASKSEGNAETGSDNDKAEKPRRRHFYRRKPKAAGDGENEDGNEKGKNNRRRRQKSRSAVANGEALATSDDSGQGTGEEVTLIDTKA